MKYLATIDYSHLEEIVDIASSSGIRIVYPIDDFVINRSLYQTYTRDRDIAFRIYSRYKDEIQALEKEYSRLTSRLHNLNNKFCNEGWLLKCPKDIVRKEYNTLCRVEEELDLVNKQIFNRKYIRLYYEDN